ncbi:hypothetical protein [Pseudovibrio sp. Ad37]|uniref:hypothetical protein n=1 Tax=Pseudovibrio sp. Ad37 TaxID=989422 RepID=UPI0007AEDCF2|nr:hypothetical protein [Pseudovibrio sp. Ad37]KZL22684.1 hypothetical protein PsAD37_03332 [Pseudovibrio sp. Ad37]
MKPTTVLTSFLALGLVFVTYTTYDLRLKIEEFEQDLQRTPPIAVVDFLEVAKSLDPGASEAEVRDVLLKVNNATMKLKEAGYLVLDREKIVNAPEDLLLPLEAIKQANISTQ